MCIPIVLPQQDDKIFPRRGNGTQKQNTITPFFGSCKSPLHPQKLYNLLRKLPRQQSDRLLTTLIYLLVLECVELSREVNLTTVHSPYVLLRFQLHNYR